ncbi:MAG: tetratricopeptide repeat protein [Candidatus Latescibacteria bacterium]|nr:tetratricopeptide repeat protein [Candidatus Latescibacterota bacterium]
MIALLALLFSLSLALACSQPDPRAEAWSQHYQAGRSALGQSRFAEAEQALSRALSLAETFAPDDPRYGRTAHQLAQLHVVRGELARAESLYQHLHKRQMALPDDHPDKMLTLDKLGDTYRLQQRPAEAAALYDRVLAFQQMHRGDEEVAATMQKLSDLYRAQGDRAATDSLAQRAQALSLRARAQALFLQGHYQQAAPLYHSALALQAGDHPDLARTCYYLGRLYDAQDRYRQAEHFYRRALAASPASDPDQVSAALADLLARKAAADHP